MMLKRICILFFIVMAGCLSAQSKQTVRSAVFEYVAAEYHSSEAMSVIELKDDKNEIYFFNLYEKDKVKNADILYNYSPDNNAVSKKICTNVELVGKKVQLRFIPMNEIDPANPYCCYQIIEVSPF